MLNSSGKSKNNCFALDLRGKVFSFLPLNITLVVGFSKWLLLY